MRGGLNISPAELDDLLAGMPQAVEAATVGIPDEMLGERIAVAVVAAPGTTPELADVTDWLASARRRDLQAARAAGAGRQAAAQSDEQGVRGELRAMVLARL